MILGPNPDTFYLASSLVLEPNSMLVLYSDGLIEHSNKYGEEFGMNGLKEWMFDCHQQSASVALSNLFDRLHSFGQNRPFQDDASAIVLFHRR